MTGNVANHIRNNCRRPRFRWRFHKRARDTLCNSTQPDGSAGVLSAGVTVGYPMPQSPPPRSRCPTICRSNTQCQIEIPLPRSLRQMLPHRNRRSQLPRLQLGGRSIEARHHDDIQHRMPFLASSRRRPLVRLSRQSLAGSAFPGRAWERGN